MCHIPNNKEGAAPESEARSFQGKGGMGTKLLTQARTWRI